MPQKRSIARNTTDRQITFGFALAVAALAGLGFYSQMSAEKVRDVTDRRARAREVKLITEQLISSLKDAETGQRGYLLTERDSYLSPYRDAVAVLPGRIAQARRMLEGDAEQLKRLDEIERLSREKLQELSETIALVKAQGGGLAAAIKVVRTDWGLSRLVELRAIVNRMQELQQQRINSLSQETSAIISFNSRIVLFGSLLALLLVSSALVLLFRNQRKRQLAEDDLIRANLSLEAQAHQLTQVVESQFAIAAGGLNSNKILELIAQQTLTLTGADGALIELVDGEDMVYHAAVGSTHSWLGMRIPMKGSLSGACVQAGRMLSSGDTETDTRVNREACRKVGVRSMIVVPLLKNHNVIGILKAHSGVAHFFNEIQERGLQLIAGLLAATWDKAVAFEEKEAAIAALEATKRELTIARDRADKAARAKSEFLANMSHEIRTPMNGVIGMAGLLLDTPLSETQREYSEAIRSSGDALLTIINDILDFSKIEAGQLRFETLDFDPRSSIGESLEMFAHQVQAKGIRLALEMDPRVPTALRGDPGRIRQVLNNLVGNAIKFTERGEVRVLVDLDPPTSSEAPARPAGTTDLRFRVRDTGIGIDPEVAPMLFQPFTQADGSTARKYGGTGLGLAISRDLVSRMGGSIRVTSHPGQGSEFTFTLRLEKATASVRAAPPAPGLAAPLPGAPRLGRVLVAEDNAVNRKIALRQLEKLGYAADAVADGLEVLQSLGKISYDLLLMDCQMPQMDGYHAAREIRKREAERGTPRSGALRIIAMTANALEGDRERCLEAGMDDYISKPVNVDRLKALIERWSTGGRDGAAAGPAGQAPAPAKHLAEPVLDMTMLDDLRTLDPALIAELGSMFIEDAPKRLQLLTRSLESGDLDAIRREAHSMKSSSGNLGLRRFAAICAAIELEAGDAASMGMMLTELVAQFEAGKVRLLEEIGKVA